MKRNADSPEVYREAVEGEQRALLEEIRRLIFDVAPKIEEKIEYGMLGYTGLANLAAQKHYVSLYVMPEVLARHKASFPGVDSGKSCLRFRRLDQLDPKRVSALLEDMIETRGQA